MKRISIIVVLLLICIFALGLVLRLPAYTGMPWNNPHPSNPESNYYYSTFSAQPKTLDPARSYDVNETAILAQVYEPILQYHYLKRPYTLIPLTAVSLPQVSYFDKQNKLLPETADANTITYSAYTIHIKPGIYYQPHPAFAIKHTLRGDQFYYQNITSSQARYLKTIADFKVTSARELTAEDYVYEIKRLAHPKVGSPIFGLMSDHIVGLKEYGQLLQAEYNKRLLQSSSNDFLDLRKYPFEGAIVLDRYTYQIKVIGKYPQFVYWLEMPFFAPVPWEADYFYSQRELQRNNITFDWYPVGTGPYMLTLNNPNSEMVLSRNPNFHGETYPTEGEKGDKEQGLLNDAGKPLPFIDKVVLNLEKEAMPRWNKFLQGYYDQSAIGSDNYDQVIEVDSHGQPRLTSEMMKKGIRLQTSVSPSIFYLGFNMLDDVVGGYSDRSRLLRQAISIVMNYEEFIFIFLNGRGFAAQGPLAPGIFGYRDDEIGYDHYVYNWINNQPVRKSIDEAKALLSKAGYPGGRDPVTGLPLVLNYDAISSNAHDEKSTYDWMRKQFNEIGISLQIRDSDYNRFQEKMSAGNTQLFSWGWIADYPDPENFMFLLYGPNGQVKTGGENAANYANQNFDTLFEKMKNMSNGSERQAIIDQMVALVQQDAPWAFGFFTKDFTLSHSWVYNLKPNDLAYNTMKYIRIDPKLRAAKQIEWNKPIFWPIGVFLVMMILVMIPVVLRYLKKEYISYRNTL